MGNFRDGNKNFRGGGSRSFSGNRFGERSGGNGGFRGRDEGKSFDRRRGPVEMHDAICSKCRNECQVPFMPTGSRPVFCSNCFEKEGDSGRGFDSRRESKPFSKPVSVSSSNNFDNSIQFKQINAKLDKIIGILQELELDVGDEEDLADDLKDLDEDEDKPKKDLAKDTENLDEDSEDQED